MSETGLQNDVRRIDRTMAREANHRVANHLMVLASLIQAHAAKVASGPASLSREAVHQALREIVAKVVALGHLHHHLAMLPPGETVDLGEYLVESAQSLVKSLSLEASVGIVHQLASKCPARADQVQPVALIASEIIMNAVKHAHPTGLPVEISVRCAREGGRTTVEVEDDGVGLPERFDPERDGGLGFRLIRQLAGSLKAELDIHSDSLGTRFRLSLPEERVQ
ncbi:MAG TPA: sensor histidine kinase [Rhizomicrobium sp.]|nr:sensor histidine kinase [Rhizomicrobium sp.]